MDKKFMKNLDDKIEHLESTVYGAGGEQPGADTQGSAETPVADPAESSVSAETTQNDQATEDNLTPSETTEAVEPKHDWEKRFKNLKRHHDAKIYELRRTIALLTEKNLSLEDEIDKLRKDILNLKSGDSSSFTELISPDSEFATILGDDGVKSISEFVQKAVKEATEPLHSEIGRLNAELREAKQKSVEEMKVSDYQRFLNALSDIVEDYEEINVDPKFIEYLNEVDPVSMQPRMHLFKVAEQARDVVRVAQFFKDFKEMSKKNKRQIIEKASVESSVGTPASVTEQPQEQQTGKMYSMREYQQFVRDVARGKYKGRESLQQKLEDEFELAFMEGRITA